MAVAVERTPHIVLDDAYRIVEVGVAAQAGYGPLQGRNLWDAFPGSKPLFHPHYEKARRTGQPVEFVQFYDGHVGRVRAVPDGSRLLIFWEMLHRLDTLTLEALYASLDGAMAAIEDAEVALRRESLRLVEGGSR